MNDQVSNNRAARKLEANVLQLAQRGKVKEAIAGSQELNRQFPRFASGWYTSSQLAEKVRNHSIALQAIENAIRLEPRESRWQLQKASCLMQSGQVELARPIVLAMEQRQLDSGYQCASLGLMLSRLDMQQQALKQYQRAISLEPERGEHFYNIATVYRFLGDFDAAEQALGDAIERNPEDFEAHRLRSDLRTQTPDKNHVTALQQTLEKHRDNPRAGIQLNYALAKELEDLGQWQTSFEHLHTGASTRRRTMRYDPKGDLDTMEKIAQVYRHPLFIDRPPGSDNAEAIFILGMPRTGSTLVERVLGEHSEVFAAGELNNFAFEMTSAVRATARPPSNARPSKIHLVEQSAGIDFKALGDRYIDSTRPATAHSQRFIDKMPVNFLYAGLIHLALPQAKIIHVKRHPLDACYAIYKNLFADAYPFSYDLEELARYYAAYERLMAHWHEVMPGVIHEIHYEEVVADLEMAARQLLAYCELDWEAQCLAYYESQAASTTASAIQVRQPVYSSSVGKWKYYRQQLGPLIDTLKTEGVEVPLD